MSLVPHQSCVSIGAEAVELGQTAPTAPAGGPGGTGSAMGRRNLGLRGTSASWKHAVGPFSARSRLPGQIGGPAHPGGRKPGRFPGFTLTATLLTGSLILLAWILTGH